MVTKSNPKHTDTSRSGDPVAWMYEYGGGTVACTVTQYEPAVLKALGYTETPLYPADRIEALEAENERLRNAMVVMDNTVRELTEALREMFEAVCGETGFAQAVRAESGIPYPWPALDLAEAMARAALEDRHD